MKLVIGGYAQGKLNTVLENGQGMSPVIFDGVLPDEKQLKTIEKNQNVIINHFHVWVRERLMQGGTPEEEMRAFLQNDKDCIIISDEIGNGIVPADAFEREYRERTGRLLAELADRADEVVRVICGIAQKIK